ncbi:hypothetical protein PHMEG_00023971 [Phytophthora megakarya]|uniref:Uncharacterized protein n=1 Tax=Phytophthora megakarya TaxID=4795 RepID=A0A225VI33_9STRA|nr:hypothetical protein PHMEG_00023971 [Phytophthora megakarya]
MGLTLPVRKVLVVRSYGAPSVGSVSSTVRGAAYMKRPPTPQWLRQKCYESRGMFAEEPGEVPTNTRKKRAPMGAPQTVAQQLLRPNRVPRACNTERRHSCSEINECNCADEDRYAPRIVRVHQKQYNTRPYSAEGRVFRRSKN